MFRNGKTVTLEVTIGELSEEGVGVAVEKDQDTLCLTVAEVSPELQKSLRLEERAGVVITVITPKSPASECDLRRGDLILEVNGQELSDVKTFSAAFAKAREGEVFRLLVQRRDNLFYTTIKAR